MRWFVFAVLVLLLGGICLPLAAGASFMRRYEATATVAYGPGPDRVAAAPCHGGQDTVADTGACVAYYVPNVLDFRGQMLVVSIQDTVFGPEVWGILVVDMDGDGRANCDAPDVCFSGEGTIVGFVPLDAAGEYVRVFPATMHSSSLGCCPEQFAVNGVVTFTFG